MSALTTPLEGLAFYLVSDSEDRTPLAAVEARNEDDARVFALALKPALELPATVDVKRVGAVAPTGVPLFRLRYLEALTTRAMEDRERSGVTCH
ncbi:hypothetical protein D7S70_26400 [Ralstonia pickettii]|nr:hypothetical protein [Ralstonia pickettii]MBB0037725.1 hypothetical protein [Ralstonia pickettii]MBB0100239.1 hypothetical protein [Ralstonia pickettii]MBB0110237.1 hypothetical protein [Ralstonia pickettii]MBB0131301.1 hypothetical protein [Ralstonia pickettii]